MTIPSFSEKIRSLAVLHQLIDINAEKQPDTELLADLVRRKFIAPASACAMLPASAALLLGPGMMVQAFVLTEASPPFPLDPYPHPSEQILPEVENLK